MTEKQKLKNKLERRMKKFLKKDEEGNYLHIFHFTVIYSNGKRYFIEWIKGTTKCFSHNRTIIYDVSFLQLYRYNEKIPEGCFACNQWICKIDKQTHINNPAVFLAILDYTYPQREGTRYYLDNKLYMKNVPFRQADKIRNDLLYQRKDGLLWFKCLTIVDPAGNKTWFYPSIKVQIFHEVDKKEKASPFSGK